MSKFYVGRDLISFFDNGRYKPVSRVTLYVDDETVITAGDDTGMELTANCPFATQAMADALLAQYKGFRYQAYEALAVNIDPSAELGDGLTADGVYSVISRTSDNGTGYPDVSAPGEAELEEEYPSAGPMTQEFNRKIAQTNSRITKTADEILLEVTGLNNKYTSLSVKVDGVTITDESGTTLIKGSSIQTDTLYVNAANINGTLTADQINLSGSITWNDLSSGVQSTINSAGGISASEARTIINSTLVSSPNIAGAKFWDLNKTSWLEVDDPAGNGYGWMNYYYSEYSPSTPVFGMGYNGIPGSYDTFEITAFNRGFFYYNRAAATAVPIGKWDFLEATVSNLHATFA